MRKLITALAFGLLLAAAPPAARAATVDGATIHWSSQGSGRQVLILVHGWTCDETSWKEQVPTLSKAYRVITLDLPGHGKSGRPNTFSMEGGDQSQLSDQKITLPVLAVFAGTRALATEPAEKTLYPNAEYHTIPETAHFLMMEKPAEFNRMLSTFVGKLR